MKKFLFSPIIRHALVFCSILTYWYELRHASLFFFGEYAYPKKEDYED